MRTCIAAILIFSAIGIAAQTRTFRWQDELCTYEGTYAGSKTPLTKLQNTLKLSRPGSYTLDRNVVVWSHEDIARIDIRTLDNEYSRKLAELKALDIVSSSYWQDFKHRKQRELEQVYSLERTTMRAYREPAALFEYTGAPACVARYAGPINAGGDALLNVWRSVNEESRIKNSDPERLRRIFESQYKSPDRMRFALVEVMNFGWSNCANALIRYVDYDGTPEREFKKLFSKVRTLRCEEP